jgi:hypothetical protein
VIKNTKVIIQGFDILDITKHIGYTNKKYQATLLSKIEALIRDRETYVKIRKDVLDSFNDYTREVVQSIFGDIENA